MCGLQSRHSHPQGLFSSIHGQNLREVRIYTVAQETLVGLSHRKGDPWRVNPFRATSRPLSGDRMMSIPVSGVRRHTEVSCVRATSTAVALLRPVFQ